MSILFKVTDILGVVLEMLVAVNFFNSISRKKQISKATRLLICILAIIIQSIAITSGYVQYIGSIAFIISILIISLMYNISWIKRAVFSVMLLTVLGLFDIITGLMYIMIFIL